MTIARSIPRLSGFARVASVVLTALLALVALPAAAARADVDAAQRTQIEQVVKDYLLAHPEVVRDALSKLDQRQKDQEQAESARAIAEHKETIFNSPHETVLGNPKGKVTLVEFFDYNCPHCRNVVGDLDHLMKANPDLRLVLKDFPILTPQSVEAAHVAIALRAQFHGDKYWQWHKMLMSDHGLVGKTQALAAAKEMGANMGTLASDMNDSEVRDSLKEVGEIADQVHAEGTPTFVIGNKVYAGEMTFDQLNPLVGNVRKCGQVACG